MGSNIKGGGRATWSESLEDDLINILMNKDNEDATKAATTSSDVTKINTGNDDNAMQLSEHKQAHQRKRFVKNLVKQYKQEMLAQKLNQGGQTTKTTTVTTTHDNGQGSTAPAASSSGTTRPALGASLAASEDDSKTNTKVRIQVVEAIARKEPNKSSKNKQSDFLNEGGWKEGTKKVMVVTRSTPVADFGKQAKAKLRLKKFARAFVVQEKIEMELVGDLSGLSDGDTVYVTAQDDDKKGQVQLSKSSSKRKDGSDEDDDNEEEDDEDETENVQTETVDPIDIVKERYSSREYKQHAPSKTFQYTDLSTHLDKLPPLSPQRSSLPAAAHRKTILKALSSSRVVIVCGSTGSGKSTQVPQYLLEGMMAAEAEGQANILCTQPRRVAATSLAYRVSDERGSTYPGRPGSVVGYHVRLDRAVAPSAKIVYCTVGILLRKLVAPPETAPLAHVSHLVIDEVHERDINTDFCLTLLRALLQKNQHVRIILMSATASEELFVNYFSAFQPLVVQIPGKIFPVDIKWLPDCERYASSQMQGSTEAIDESDGMMSTYSLALSPRARAKIDNSFVQKLIAKIIASEQQSRGAGQKKLGGAILVFLPGKAEIEALAKALSGDAHLRDKNVCRIVKLHGTLPRSEQKLAFDAAPGDSVKVILATNVAETSITIEDVSHVIDTGRVKENRFNAESRMSELVTVWTSRASATQRCGRAGRTSTGTCWRLYSKSFCDKHFPLQTPPEILRTPLDSCILQICLLYEHRRTPTEHSTASQGVRPVQFLGSTPEPPPEQSIVEGCRHLLEVGAVRLVLTAPDFRYRLTPLGYHLSRLPVDAKVGKVLIVGCMLGVLDNALTIAACLSCSKPIFLQIGSGKEWQSRSVSRAELIESGFGGRNWKGGTVKGDSFAQITVFSCWSRLQGNQRKAEFCRGHALNNSALIEVEGIRAQLKDCLTEARFIEKGYAFYNHFKEDALLTSCCLVAGLYPNICTLMRPRKGGLKGGRLVTKDGDICRPSSGSFQRQRIFNASEAGKDAYAVFHVKHRSVGTGDRPGDVFLSEVNFVARFALLLFGGDLQIRDNAVIVDEWLKFKVGADQKKTRAGAVLILELRKQLDRVVLDHFTSPAGTHGDFVGEDGSSPLIRIVRRLLADEMS